MTWKMLLLLSTTLLVTSCAHINYENQTGKPVSFTRSLGKDRDYKVVRHVDDQYRRNWLLLYLVPLGNDGGDMLARSVAGADGMANLDIRAQYSFTDVLLTNLTLGIYCSRTVNIRGDLVEFEKPKSALREPVGPLRERNVVGVAREFRQ